VLLLSSVRPPAPPPSSVRSAPPTTPLRVSVWPLTAPMAAPLLRVTSPLQVALPAWATRAPWPSTPPGALPKPAPLSVSALPATVADSCRLAPLATVTPPVTRPRPAPLLTLTVPLLTLVLPVYVPAPDSASVPTPTL